MGLLWVGPAASVPGLGQAGPVTAHTDRDDTAAGQEPPGRERPGAGQVVAALVVLATGLGGWLLVDHVDAWAWDDLTTWLAAHGAGRRALAGAAVGAVAGLPLLLVALPRVGRWLLVPAAVYGILCIEAWWGSWAVAGHGETCEQPGNWAQCDYAGVAVPATVTGAAAFAVLALTAVLLGRRRWRREGRPGRASRG